jgi:hypothetical protein
VGAGGGRRRIRDFPYVGGPASALWRDRRQGRDGSMRQEATAAGEAPKAAGQAAVAAPPSCS